MLLRGGTQSLKCYYDKSSKNDRTLLIMMLTTQHYSDELIHSESCLFMSVALTIHTSTIEARFH